MLTILTKIFVTETSETIERRFKVNSIQEYYEKQRINLQKLLKLQNAQIIEEYIKIGE